MKHFTQLSLQDLWVRALQDIDSLHDEAQRNDAEMSATDVCILSKALCALRKDGPLSDPAPGEIGRIEDLLCEAIARETLGYRNVFDGTDDPDHGAIGRVLTVPILSKKGKTLDALQQRFRKILVMRDLLSARVDAGCQMARLEATGNHAIADERAA